MNTLIAQGETTKLERAIKKASRVLLELEVVQSNWEAKRGMGKIMRNKI
jgi:hypothetical protein